MTIEASELFKYVIYIILIIFLPLVFLLLSMVLFKAYQILSDSRKVSKTVASLNKDEESTQKFVQDVTAGTINNVIDTQTQNMTKVISAKLSALIANKLQ